MLFRQSWPYKCRRIFTPYYFFVNTKPHNKAPPCFSSDNCRGLCGVPPGLETSCSQQFVQKKLVALHPSGDRLVEDMFWFPSCCVCQITKTQ